MYLFALSAETVAEKKMGLAMAKMTSGLIVLWIFVGGGLMYRFRDSIRARVLASPWSWKKKFVIFATLMACLEEVVTVSMTNLATVFGSSPEIAHITASTNYFDTILFHSVIVFIPYFIVLAYVILPRYDFKPFGTFLAFGVVGTVGEAIFAGNFSVFIGFPMWAFVYGLMVYLPMYSLPENRGTRPVNFFHYIALGPALFLMSLPLIVPIVGIITGILDHPSVHY